jgi:hypothetical protein
VHKLLNTNEQNYKYYGKSDLCPCCHLNRETVQHVFTCPAQEVLDFRRKQQTILWHQLSLINTPESLLADIHHGILSLESKTPKSVSASRSIAAADQFTLGWDAFLRGRISIQWQYAFTSGEDCDRNSMKWAGNLVLHILQYSQQLWTYRCGVLHGHDKEESRQHHREDLLHQIQVAYEDYSKDPFCVPSDWHSLFHCPLHTYYLSDRDTLACWLKSYSEAQQQQALLMARQQQASKQFFVQSKPTATSISSASPDLSSIEGTISDYDLPTSMHDDDSDLETLSYPEDNLISWDDGEEISWAETVSLDVY